MFLVTLASAEEQIKDLIDDERVLGIALDLESIGDRASRCDGSAPTDTRGA
jgi:hypothetical protein